MTQTNEKRWFRRFFKDQATLLKEIEVLKATIQKGEVVPFKSDLIWKATWSKLPHEASSLAQKSKKRHKHWSEVILELVEGRIIKLLEEDEWALWTG